MRKLIFITFFLFCSHIGIAQKQKAEIEINPYVRWDNYPKFFYAINPTNNNEVNIKGTSWGINSIYKIPFKTIYLTLGMGFYKYSFNKIKQTNSSFGISNSRVINYIPPGPISPSIIFNTDKYYYNTLAFLVGLEKRALISNDIELISSFQFANQITFSQYYHITNPTEGTAYKKWDSRYFGLSANMVLGIQKKYKKLSLGPEFILPVFSNWHADELFPEEKNSMSRSKWLKGIGIGTNFTFYF